MMENTQEPLAFDAVLEMVKKLRPSPELEKLHEFRKALEDGCTLLLREDTFSALMKQDLPEEWRSLFIYSRKRFVDFLEPGNMYALNERSLIASAMGLGVKWAIHTERPSND